MPGCSVYSTVSGAPFCNGVARYTPSTNPDGSVLHAGVSVQRSWRPFGASTAQPAAPLAPPTSVLSDSHTSLAASPRTAGPAGDANGPELAATATVRRLPRNR